MVNINFSIPAELHKKLKIKAATQGITLKEFVINSIQKKFQSSEENLANETE